jgi:LysM repeat protein
MKPASLSALALFLTGAAVHASPPGPCGSSHRVVRGDTLYSIARRCRGSVAGIAAASGLADPTRIEIGQRLTLSGHGGQAPRAAPEDRTPAPAELRYRMERGDTLYSLARWSRVGLPALLAANPGIDPRKIEIGDLVRLPHDAAPPERDRMRQRGRAHVQSPPAPRGDADDGDSAKPESEGEPRREAEPEGM